MRVKIWRVNNIIYMIYENVEVYDGRRTGLYVGVFAEVSSYVDLYKNYRCMLGLM